MKAPGWGCGWVTRQRPRGPAVTTSSVGGAASPVGPGRPHALSGTSDTPQLRRGRASSRPAGSPAWLSPPSWPCHSAPLPPNTRTSVTQPRVARTLPRPHTTCTPLPRSSRTHISHRNSQLSRGLTHTTLSQSYTLTRGLTHPHASLSHSHTTLTQTLTPTKFSYGHTLTPHPHTHSPPTVTHTTVARHILMVTHASHAHASLRHNLTHVCTTRTWPHSFLTHTLTHSLSPPPPP